MRIPRIHEPEARRIGDTLTLSALNRRHLVKALRLSDGDVVDVFDGDGGEFRAQLRHTGGNNTQVELTEALSPIAEAPVAVTIGLAMSLGDRMEYAIQKATELGAAAFVPLQSERSELRLKGERLQKKQARWQQVAISAAEQSGRARVPEVARPQSLKAWLESAPKADLSLFLHHEAETPLAHYPAPATMTVIIGPEGGLSDEDRDDCIAAGFSGLRLGPRVMRTETAPVALLAAVQTLWGDFR